MKIIKVINNNTVCVLDDKRREQIISGKGIGFGKKFGDRPDADKIEKMYLITDSALRKRLIECLTEIPYEYIKLTEGLAEQAAKELDCELNESLMISLSDHIYFAVQRKQQGIEFENPLMEAISDYFPKELELGRRCIDEVKRQMGVQLAPDEAGFAAMHIINARMGTKMSQITDITKLVESCAALADTCFGGKLDKSSVAYERFLVHLKFLAKRLFTAQELPQVLSRDEDLLELTKIKFKKQYKCAECIQDHILKNYKKSISEEELLTLTLHLRRISA